MPSPASSEPRIFSTLSRDAGELWTEVRNRGVRRSVARTFDELQAFYLTDERRRRLARMGRVRRWLRLSFWLVKSLFFKLTPARRVLLLVALLSYIQSAQQASVGAIRISVQPSGLGTALLLLLLMLELKDKLLAKTELADGRAVQLALMPTRPPVVPGWQVWMSTRPANDVGGDLVDSIGLDLDRVGLVLADVSGKGLPAALLMTRLQATLAALVTTTATPGALGTALNTTFRRQELSSRFATLVYLELGAASGVVTLVNAGHMPPLLVRAGAVEELPRGGPALGIVRDAVYETQVHDLSPGTTLVVYSDGVTEAMNDRGEFFGEDRLRALVAAQSALAPSDLANRILAAVNAFVDHAPSHDDLSLLIVKRL